MITHQYFNKVISDYFETTNNETVIYLKNAFRNHYASNYFDFFDEFLGHYGINSINYDIPSHKNKYDTYVNFQSENIFNEPKGIKDLTEIPLTKKRSQETLANYLISKLNFIRPEKFENWTN